MVGIYKITNPKGEVYIGQSIDIKKRFLSHRCSENSINTTKLTNSFIEFGFNNHKFEIIFECGQLDLCLYESYFIDKYNSIVFGLNSVKPLTDYSKIVIANECSKELFFNSVIEDPTRGAGRKSEYKQGVEVVRLQRRVPKQKVEEIDQAIEQICKTLKTKK